MRCIIFDHKRNDEVLEELKVEPVYEKIRPHKSNLTTTCNKNEEQQDAKNNAKL